MTDPTENSVESQAPDFAVILQGVKVALVESAASWAVRRALETGYRFATGHVPPTARDRDVPMRQILAWAAVSSAAVAMANVAVDQFALRREPPDGGRQASPGTGPGNGTETTPTLPR